MASIFVEYTKLMSSPYPPLVQFITSLSRFIAYLCIVPISFLGILDILGWFLFKVLWRPLGYYPRLRKYRDPDPLQLKTTPSPSSSSNSPELTYSPNTLKRHNTLPILRIPGSDHHNLRRSGSLESLASVGTEGPMVSWDRDDVSEWERDSSSRSRSSSVNLLNVASPNLSSSSLLLRERERKVDMRGLKMSKMQ